MVDCYGKSRSVIYAIIIHVLPMVFLMALFVGLRKKHQNPLFFAGNFLYRYRETSRNFPASFTPPTKRGCWLQPPFFCCISSTSKLLVVEGCRVFPRFLFNKLWTSMECCDAGCVFLCLPWSIKTQVAFAKPTCPTLCSPWSRDLPRTMKGAIMHLQDRYVARFFSPQHQQGKPCEPL